MKDQAWASTFLSPLRAKHTDIGAHLDCQVLSHITNDTSKSSCSHVLKPEHMLYTPKSESCAFPCDAGPDAYANPTRYAIPCSFLCTCLCLFIPSKTSPLLMSDGPGRSRFIQMYHCKLSSQPLTWRPFSLCDELLLNQPSHRLHPPRQPSHRPLRRALPSRL